MATLDSAAKRIADLLNTGSLARSGDKRVRKIAEDACNEAKRLVASMTSAERERAGEAIFDYIVRQGIEGAEEAFLYDVARFIDNPGTCKEISSQPLAVDPNQKRPATTKVPVGYEVYAGRGVAPTSFLRTATFASEVPGIQLFPVLGMPNVAVERGAQPLDTTHLHVLIYLAAQVQEYDPSLGANVTFRPRDAILALGWTDNGASKTRLRDAVEALAGTTIRIREGDEYDTQEAASVVGRRVTRLEDRRQWEVQLLSTLLRALVRFHTYVDLRMLAVLPNGAATRLYLFLCSERNRESEWDVERLAAIAGLSSADAAHLKRKMAAALQVLVDGVVTKRARGKAVYAPGKGELDFNAKGELVACSTSSHLVHFPPVVDCFSFRKDGRARERVKIVKKERASAA